MAHVEKGCWLVAGAVPGTGRPGAVPRRSSEGDAERWLAE